jgi:hypothetical protein
VFFQDAHVLPKWLSYEEYCRQVINPSPSDCILSQVGMLLILWLPFTTSMEERDRCYSFVLSRTPHETGQKVNVPSEAKKKHMRPIWLLNLHDHTKNTHMRVYRDKINGSAVSVLGVRLRKLSNVLKGQSSDGWPKFLSRAPPCLGTLSCWSRLQFQSFVPTPVSRWVDVRPAAGKNKSKCRIFITIWWKTCCTDPT